ncbi:unnamed protein product [Schistosoma curassoni]|uniref:cDNA n=1 Tax=Schistosoma curassoni TaxID=6186 RepID=A0A183JZT9_9TREM|nr:unnamed protein product [Schistosoma curassoni]
MIAGDQRLIHMPLVSLGSWNPFTPLVWDQGFATPLGGLSVSTHPVKAPDVRFPSSQLRKQHLRREKSVSENKPDPSGGRNQEEALEVDRTHIEESTQLRHKTSPHMESSRPKEKRKTKVHITPGNGDRHEKNEQELDGTRKEDPGQSGLENAGRRPTLHWE